jgi:hypothetical protein
VAGNATKRLGRSLALQQTVKSNVSLQESHYPIEPGRVIVILLDGKGREPFPRRTSKSRSKRTRILAGNSCRAADIHPRTKQDVGKRLALVALAKTYGRKDVVWSGPMYQGMVVRGDKAFLRFDFAEDGLMSKDGKPLTWFTIAGADGKFEPADAVIEGKTVVVSSPKVTDPKAVRFAWDESAQPNFCNKTGLPAVPFRTDGPQLEAAR